MKILEALQQTFGKLFDSLILGFADLLGALLIIFIGRIIARSVSKLVAKLLDKLKLDELANRLNDSPSLQKMNIKVKPVAIAKSVVYWVLMLVFILTAAEVMELTVVTEQIMSLLNYIPTLLTAVIILGIGLYLGDMLRNVVGTACKSMGINAWKSISTLVFYIVVLFVFITALNHAGIDTDILTSNISLILGGILLAFAIAYGFASRDSLSSILASFYTRNNFEVGQEIEIDGVRGTIVKMDSVSLVLNTREKTVVFPLKRLISDQVVIHQDA